MIIITYNSNDFNLLENLSKVFANIEIRLDLSKLEKKYFPYIFQNISNSIATKKGKFEKCYKDLLESVKSGVSYIDYDYLWGEDNYNFLLQEMSKLSINPLKMIILSHHIDGSKITTEEIINLISNMKRYNSRYIKIVLENINSEEQYNNIEDVLLFNSNRLAIYASGLFGPKSRRFAYLRNCPLNYAKIEKICQINTSQLSINEYLEIIKENYG